MRQCGCQLIRLKPKRPWLALEGDPALGVDELDAVRPSRVRLFGRVAKLIQHGRNLDAESADAGSCHQRSFFFVLRAREDNFILEVALHLPDVTGMRFADVDDQESDAAPILLVEFVESGNLPPEGRSSVTAKYEHDRLLLVERGKLNASALIELDERKVRSRVANIESARASAGPESFKWEEKEHGRPRHPGHDPPKGLRRPMHRAPDEGSKNKVRHDKHCDKAQHEFLDR